MSKIRVVLACPQVEDFYSWRQMLNHHLGIEIVGEAENLVDTLLEVGSNSADIAVIDLTYLDKDPGICSHLLSEYPHIKVIAVSQGLDCANVYEKGIVKRHLEDTSPDIITNVILSSNGDRKITDF